MLGSLIKVSVLYKLLLTRAVRIKPAVWWMCTDCLRQRKGESAHGNRLFWAPSNAIAYEMKFHFRWHQIERRGEKEVASSTLPLTISSVESNQGGTELKFLLCFLPHHPPFPPSFITWDHDECCGRVRGFFSFFNHEYFFSCEDSWALWHIYCM